MSAECSGCPVCHRANAAGNDDRKLRAASADVLAPDASTFCCEQPARDGQAHPRARRAGTCGSPPIEALEQMIELGDIESWTMVAHGEVESLTRRPSTNFYG